MGWYATGPTGQWAEDPLLIPSPTLLQAMTLPTAGTRSTVYLTSSVAGGPISHCSNTALDLPVAFLLWRCACDPVFLKLPRIVAGVVGSSLSPVISTLLGGTASCETGYATKQTKDQVNCDV